MHIEDAIRVSVRVKTAHIIKMNCNILTFCLFVKYRIGMQVPPTWQGIPAQPQLPGTPQITAQSTALQQAPGLMFPIQQYQVSIMQKKKHDIPWQAAILTDWINRINCLIHGKQLISTHYFPFINKFN